MTIDLKRLFHPRHIAVVGASPLSAHGRFDYLDWHMKTEFPGRLYPVNPRYETVRGYTCYPGLKDIPGTVDLAIMMVSAEKVVAVLEDTPPDKVKFVAVITSGFSEIGRSGLEQDLIMAARAKNIRLLGPNCMGVYSRTGRVAQVIDQPYGPEQGEIAVVGQSGGNSVNIVRAGENSGVAVNYGISIGNQSDLSIEDILEWYDTDKTIKIITAYVEDIKKAPEFMKMAREISLRKPIILWKGGVTGRGAQAANSHTGAMAVSKDIWDGVVHQTGIIPADNPFEMIDMSRALLWETLPQGPGVGLIAPGGGTSVYMTDRTIKAGLQVPLLSATTRETLAGFIAKVNTIIDNPIDMGAASFQPSILKDTISVMAEDDGIHSFIIYHYIYPNNKTGARDRAREFLKVIHNVRRTIDKPIYLTLYCPFQNSPEIDQARRDDTELMQHLKIPYAVDLENCVSMVKRIRDYACYLSARKGAPEICTKAAV